MPNAKVAEYRNHRMGSVKIVARSEAMTVTASCKCGGVEYDSLVRPLEGAEQAIWDVVDLLDRRYGQGTVRFI